MLECNIELGLGFVKSQEVGVRGPVIRRRAGPNINSQGICKQIKRKEATR